MWFFLGIQEVMEMDEKLVNELLTLNMSPHSRSDNPRVLDFHLHDTYEIYFFIEGDVTYFVENNSYPMRYGDLIITNTTEIHTPIFHSPACYERIIFHFTPYFLKYIQVPGFNPERHFNDRPNGMGNKVSLNSRQIEEFMEIYRSVDSANKNLTGDNLLKKFCSLIELAAMVNRVFSDRTPYLDSHGMSGKISDIMKYIDKNLDGKITLKTLSEKFFINDTYLCTLFKKHVGKTVHQYLTFKRIAYAKRLLSSGYNVTETSLLCGFNDYSNFIKAFKRITGETPGKHKQNKLDILAY
jgi:AraC-like DNA-binding protein